MRTLLLLFALVAFSLGPPASTAHAQVSSMDVRLFQNFFQDAAFPSSPYIVPEGAYLDQGSASTLAIGASGGIPIKDAFELGGRISYVNTDLDDGDDASGIADPLVFGKYHFRIQDLNRTDFATGAWLTLPIGEEDVGGGGDANFGFFGAVRQPLRNERFTLTGNIGLDFSKGPSFWFGCIWVPYFNPITGLFEFPGTCVPGPAVEGERETSFGLGGGVLYQATNQLHLVGELKLQTEFDYAALSGGAAYKLSDVARLRGSLLVGLDDGAPDVSLYGGVLFAFE